MVDERGQQAECGRYARDYARRFQHSGLDASLEEEVTVLPVSRNRVSF